MSDHGRHPIPGHFGAHFVVDGFLRAHQLAELPVVGVDQLAALFHVHPYVGGRHVLAVQVYVARVGRDCVVVHGRYEPRRYERTGRMPAFADDEVVRGQRRIHRQHLNGAPVLPGRGPHHRIQLAPVQLLLPVVATAPRPAITQAQHDDGGRRFQMEQHRQRVDAYVPVVVHAPRHYRVGEAHHRPEHHEPVVQPETVLAVTGYHNAVPDVVVVQHGHVRLAVVLVRADVPAGLQLLWRMSETGTGDARKRQQPGDVSQRHWGGRVERKALIYTRGGKKTLKL